MKPFVHLHVHSQYSLLDGATKISKMFTTCKQRNFPAIAITDHGNMHGVVNFISAAKDYNKKNPDFPVKAIIGCEFYVCPDLTVKQGKIDLAHIVLLAKTQEGYTNLTKLNTIAYVDGFYYKPRIDYKTLKEHSKGLVCLSGCIAGDIQQLLLLNQDDEAEKLALELKGMFEEGDFYMELQDHDIEEQKRLIPKQIALANKIGVKCVVTNDVHYVNKEDYEMQDVMMCVNMGKKFDDPDRLRMPTHEFYLKTYDEMHERFSNFEDALDNTLEIASKCDATVLFGQDLSPAYVADDDISANDRLRTMVYEGLEKRYGTITDEIKERTEFELGIICKMGYADYFLIVWDFIEYCNKNDIPVGPGRGSAAGSIVAYALNITRFDPLKYDLLFERFLNPDRISMPDVDTDFCANRRGEVVEYVGKKYGRDRVCQIATFGTMAAKAAIKDVARVLNFPYSEVDKLTKAMPLATGPYAKDPIRKMFGVEVTGENVELAIPDLKKAYEENSQVKRVIDLAIRLEGMPRNVSMHAAAVVICNRPIGDTVPLARSGNDILTQFNYKECEDIGTLKMDFLGLRTLTDLKGTIDMVKQLYGKEIDFYSSDFSYDDPEVFKIISDGNTAGIFQLESGGMTGFMKELQPESMDDLIAGIALYRPGPMGIIPDYIKCKRDKSQISYLHPDLEPILKSTYGFIVYQEQVMQIVQKLAGYTLARGDSVRKMMGKKQKDKIVEERQIFLHGLENKENSAKSIKGALAMGVSEEVANKLWDNMETFGQYGFNKSHSAGYAHVAYQTAFLKKYYEAPFIASLLNNRLNVSDEIKKYIAHAKKRNIKILPPDVNKSQSTFTVVDNQIRYGLAALKNVGILVTDAVVKNRNENGEFKSLEDFISRLEGPALNKRFIESMILSGALDCFGKKRSQMMQVYSEIIDRTIADRKNTASGQFSLFDRIEDVSLKEVNYPQIPEFNKKILLKYEKQVVGTYVSGHPLEDEIERFNAFNLTSDMLEVQNNDDEMQEEGEQEQVFEGDLQDGMKVVCGGIISESKKLLTRQSNKEMAIIKLEDLVGDIKVMITPAVYDKVKTLIEVDSLITVHGKLSLRSGEEPIVVCEKIDVWEKTEGVEQAQMDLSNENLPPVQKLYLKYSTLDSYKATQIMNILAGHAGDSEIIVKCSETGAVGRLGFKVRISEELLAELKGELDEKDIIVK